jgi:TonB family protein
VANTSAQPFKGTVPQSIARGPFAPLPAPLLALTQDERFLATLRKISEPAHAVHAAGSEIDLAAGLMAQHAGVAVLDSAAVATPIEQLAGRLHTQFPDLVLIVAGNAEEQGTLAAQITDGSVHRFLHKPVSEQRVRLFVEAAWRRHEEARSRQRAAAAVPTHPRRGRWGVIAAALIAVAAALAWLLTRPPPTETPAPAAPAAANTAAAANDAALEDFLARADKALAEGALVAPAGDNAADLYREALRRNARDPRAVNGLEQVIDRLVTDAEAQLQEHRLDAAQQLADEARAINPSHPRVAFLIAQIGAQRERAVLGKAQRAAAGGDVGAALAVLDDATRGGHRSTLVDEARQQLAQKQIDERVADFVARGRDALGSGALLEPPEQNAHFFIESARALAANEPAVQQARQDLIARLESEARKAVAAGNAEQADTWVNAAADAGAEPAEVEALHASAQQLRGAAKAATLARVESLFNQRLAQGHMLEPASDSAKYYLEQLAQAEPAAASTLAARTAFETRLLDEARGAVQAKDYAAARRWLSEAHSAGASPAGISAAEAELSAAQSAEASGAPSAADAVYLNESALTRTRYVAPQYPPSARDRGIAGWVDVQFLVNPDGSTSEVTIVGAQPVGIFEQAALDAVRHWRYQPLLHDGAATTQRARVRVRFAVKS